LWFVLERPDKIRERAQYTAAVAGVAAAATIAGSLSSRVPPAPSLVLGLAACAWAGCLFVWIYAMAGSLQPVERHLYANRSAVDLPGAIAQARSNAAAVRGRLVVARWATGLATLITVVGLGWGAAAAVAASTKTDADISLTGPGAEALSATCGWSPSFSFVLGQVTPADLGKPVVTIKILDADAAKRGADVTAREVAVRSNHVIAAVELAHRADSLARNPRCGTPD
jgi:hypothetical protein